MCNYDSLATDDCDDCCEDPADATNDEGCMDEEALNYDADTLQLDNARLRGVLIGKESDVETQDD